MAGGLERLLTLYQRIITGNLRLIFPHPLARCLMRWLRIQNGIAAHYRAEAHVFANRGEYENAIRACEASIAVQPDDTSGYEVLAQIFAHLRRYEDAIEACANALAVKSDSDAISASLRQILPLVRQSSQPERVIGALQKCLAASPARGDVLTPLIEMLLASHRYVEVVQACQSLLQADPEFFPAAETIRNLLKDPAARQALANIDVPNPSTLSDEYDWLVADNILDSLLFVMSKFYATIGIDPQTAPLVQGLERAHRSLAAQKPDSADAATQSTLILFERAWKDYRADRTAKALTVFEGIISDAAARPRAAHNSFVREAVVRSGEILGRHYDTLGDTEKAIDIYRKVLSVDSGGVTARRLIVLLSRSGRLREAAELAETAIISHTNLFRYIPANQHMAALKSELFVNRDTLLSSELRPAPCEPKP